MAITWTQQTGGGALSDHFCSCSSSDGTILYTSNGSESIYKSTNSGVTWKSTIVGFGLKDIACSSDGSKIIGIQANGFIKISVNSGSSWTQVGDYKDYWQSVACSSDGVKMYAVSADGYIYKSSNSGTSFTSQYDGNNNYGVCCSSDGSYVIKSGDYIYTSSDSGANWTVRSYLSSNKICCSSDGSKVYTYGYNGGAYTIYYSSNSGVTFNSSVNTFNSISSIDCSSDGNICVVCHSTSTGQARYTINNGTNWDVQDIQSGKTGRTISMSSDGSKLIAGLSTNCYPYTGVLQISSTKTYLGFF